MNNHRNFFLLLILASTFAMTIIPSYASSIGEQSLGIYNVTHSITGNLTDPECANCHVLQTENLTEIRTENLAEIRTEKLIQKAKKEIKEEAKQYKKEEKTLTKTIKDVLQSFGNLFQSKSLTGGMSSVNNYTIILTVGQTPDQLGPFFCCGNYNGWSWLDTDGFGTENQRNLVAFTVYDNSTGTIKPVTGLATLPIWPQASYRQYSGAYSYKADTDPSPIGILSNYPDMTDIQMIKEVNLTGVTNANIIFWEWYSMELDWDYGYVAVSIDGSNTWTNIPGTRTTNINPNGNNLGNGITGNSGGVWVQETMDLTPYVGRKILLGFRFKSDEAVNEEGWYVDDILVTGNSGTITLLNDSAEIYPIIKMLVANVTYPHLYIAGATDPLRPTATLQYTQRTQQVKLKEDANSPGTYIGYFKYDVFADQYSGNYTITLETTINHTSISTSVQFQTTTYGCQNCHNRKQPRGSPESETSFVHGEGGGMQSCTYLCHSGSRGFLKYGGDGSLPWFGPPIDANPMHVHEMRYGHRGGYLGGAWYTQPEYDVPAHINISCTRCHTSFIHNNTGPDIQTIASYTLYGKNISFLSDMHRNMTCENCHGTLDYPTIPQNQYVLQGRLGDYQPSFTSSESFTDTYIIAVNGTQNIDMTITAESTTDKVSLYIIGPVDNTTSRLQGPCYGSPCEKTQSLTTPLNLNIANPYVGTWIVKVIQLQNNKINYTISSNYPIQRKPVIQIPECNSCHNSNGIGVTYTKYEIPNWNGYAHADSDKDGNQDMQCRLCHNSVHDLTIKRCQDCHNVVSTDHIIKEPKYSQYDSSQCLSCHGDTHKIVKVEEEFCIRCHGTNYTGSNPVALSIVDIELFNNSIHNNINSTPTNVVNDNDCWSCHHNEDMNRSNIRKCRDCHREPQKWHGYANITANISELSVH